MRPLRNAPDRHPVLITEARRSADDEFSSRRRRYLIMMAGRAMCVLGAVFVYKISPWLAAAFLVGAAVLPWAAVLIANDRPAKKAVRFRRFLPTGQGGPRELAAGPPAEPRREQPPAGDRAEGPTVIDL